MKGIEFVIDGQTIKGKLFLPDVLRPKNPAALLIHGWESRQERGFILARALRERGFICMTFDLRGHGKSEGDIEKLFRKDFLEDAVTAYDFLTQMPEVDPKNVIAIGSSFGSYLSALLSSERELSALILRVPSNYEDKGFTEPQYGARNVSEHKEWLSQIHDSAETMALRAIHDFPGRILIVESEKDELVPSAVIQSYAKAAPEKSKMDHVVMKGAPHSLSDDEPRQREFAEIVKNWLK